MFFDVDPRDLIPDASYYFDVCVINIAVRESLGGEFQEIWDLSRILMPRPIVYHVFADDDRNFRKQERVDVEIVHHCVVEVDGSEVSFFTTDSSEMCEDEDEDGNLMEMDEPNDFWRF